MTKQTKQIKRMDPKEFKDFGYLQEVNRQFFHPLGLALEVIIEEGTTGKVTLGGIWDFRSEPEGLVFPVGQMDPLKAERVDAARQEKSEARRELQGSVVQPIQVEEAEVEAKAEATIGPQG